MKKTTVLLVFILISCFVVRLYRLNNPIADWHSWRQADTSAVSRNFIKYGFDILHPRFDDLSNVPSGIDNPHGYRFVEFPIYNLLQAGFFLVFHGLTLEEWGRVVTIIGSVLSTLLLFLIVRRYADEKTALFAAFFYALTPYNIYYGRVILPDPLMVTASLGGIYFFLLAVDKKNEKRNLVYFLLSAVSTSVAILLKPYALFFTLPLVYLSFERYRLSIFKQWILWIYALIAIIPFILWRGWISQFPEGIPAYKWLFNGNGIRFRPAFFRWLGYERLTKLISGYSGIFLIAFGVARLKYIKNSLFFLSFLISSIIYISIIATGNVQHDYYQILVMPSIAICMALGVSFLLNITKKRLFIGYGIVGVLLVTMLYFSWHYVKDYFNINNRSIVIAGKIVDEKTPKNAKIIAPYGGDTSFLYQTNRQGWPSFEKPIPELVKMGASYMIIANPNTNDFSGFGKQYQIIASSPQYLLLKLH